MENENKIRLKEYRRLYYLSKKKDDIEIEQQKRLDFINIDTKPKIKTKKEIAREYYLENKDIKQSYKKQYNIDNKEKVSVYAKTYYQKNIKKIKAYSKVY